MLTRYTAEIVDEVLPYGSIMAGELEKFWLKKRGSEGGADA